MTTKATEAATGCFAKALEDEPMFVLLARDPDAPRLVRAWADKREATNAPDPRWETGLDGGGKRSANGGEWVTPPHPDAAQIAEARYCAARMEVWRYENDGKWREPGK